MFLGARQSERIDRAFQVAKAAHRGQRQRNGAAYFHHPLRVARQVCKVTHTTEMVCAALLHDVVEDTPVSLDEIRKDFGPTVARLVDGLSCGLTPADGNRATRKRLERERLAQAGAEVTTVKVADVIDNVTDIVVVDTDFARVYLPEQLMLVEALETADFSLREQALRLIKQEMKKLEAMDMLLA